MRGKKIGDLVEKNSNRIVHEFSEIEEIIFPQNIKNGEESTWNYIFNEEIIIEPRLANRINISENTKIGTYEQRLISKIIESQDPLLFIKGVVGSGKSSAISYIRKLLEDTPITVNGAIVGERTIFYLDFNGYRNRSTNDETIIINDLKKTCANKIRLIIEYNKYITSEEEVTSYWTYLRDKAVGSEVNSQIEDFSTLLLEYSDINTNLNDISEDFDLIKREQVKKSFLRNPDNCLFYYFEMLVYIRLRKFNNDKSAFIFIFDNIDSAPVIVQSAFAQIIKPYKYHDSPRIIVPIRSRTLDRIHFDYFSSIPNFIDQEGPAPIKVIVTYLRNFLDNKEYYFGLNRTINNEEFDLVYQYLAAILMKFEDNENDSQEFSNFINYLCGKCIRLALQIADGLFYIDEEMDRKLLPDQDGKIIIDNFNLYDVTRCMLRRGKGHIYQGNNGQSLTYYPINSIFNYDKNLSIGKDLVKLRILQFLNIKNGSSPNDVITLGDLTNEMTNFGYTITDNIRPAINDLLVVHRQLIMTNDLDGYEEQEFASATNAKVSITEIGKGYLKLVKSLNYIQELMMDACVTEKDFSRNYPIDRFPSKLKLIQHYIQYLFTRDIEEIRKYFGNSHSTIYMEFYGNYPITWDIIISVVNSINNISYSQINNKDYDETHKVKYRELISYNNNFLIPSVKSKTEKLFNTKILET